MFKIRKILCLVNAEQELESFTEFSLEFFKKNKSKELIFHYYLDNSQEIESYDKHIKSHLPKLAEKILKSKKNLTNVSYEIITNDCVDDTLAFLKKHKDIDIIAITKSIHDKYKAILNGLSGYEIHQITHIPTLIFPENLTNLKIEHIKKVLLGVKFNSRIKSIAKFSYNLAEVLEKDFELIHILDKKSFSQVQQGQLGGLFPLDFHPSKSALLTDEITISNRALMQMDEILKSVKPKNHKITATSQVKKGDINHTLTSLAQKNKNQILIIGSNEKSFIENLIMGNHALMVYEEANCPILII